jgi:Tol biopolymer transport system component
LTGNIKVMNADGTDQVELTPITLWLYPGAEEYTPRSLSWSPDGRKIAFDDENEIFTINIDGSDKKRLTDDPGYDIAPSWSPDGSRILFASSRSSDGNLHLDTMNAADGSDVRALQGGPYPGEDLSPDWSPSGDKIVFVGVAEDFHPIVYIANTDGTNRQYFDGDLSGSIGDLNKPKWSPDGSKIVFYNANYFGDDAEIYVKNVDATGFVQFTNTPGKNFQPSWQPLSSNVLLSGRVTTPDGRGLRNAVVAITDSLGVTKTVTSSSFGYYAFDDVRRGESYVVAIMSRRYHFAARTIQVNDDLVDVDFVGQERRGERK